MTKIGTIKDINGIGHMYIGNGVWRPFKNIPGWCWDYRA